MRGSDKMTFHLYPHSRIYRDYALFKDVIFIVLWVNSVIAGVQCFNCDWGMYVGP